MDKLSTEYCTRYLWFGPFGSGKTHMIGTLHKLLKEKYPESKGVYVFDFDMGLKTLENREGCEDIGSDVYIGKRAVPKLQEKITARYEELLDYKALAFDSMTLFQQATLKWIISERELKRQLGFIPNQNDYGALIHVLTELLNTLQQLSQTHYIVLTAHEFDRREEVKGVLETVPSVIGKRLPTSIGAWFNEVWNVTINGMDDYRQQTVQTVAADYKACKSQVHGMPGMCDAEEALKRSLGVYGEKTTKS